MYLHATDKVMKDDKLLALFDIPKILGRACASWQLTPSSYDYRPHGFLYG